MLADRKIKIGFTGHQRLRPPASWGWVRGEINRLLSRIDIRICGITSLAVGADQIFAESILKHDGVLVVLIPFEGYQLTFKAGDERREYQRLLASAIKVEVLQRKGTNEEAYMEAGKQIVDKADLMLAVWDGKPAAGLGGTADIVCYAQHEKKRLIHLNPYERTVTEHILEGRRGSL